MSPQQQEQPDLRRTRWAFQAYGGRTYPWHILKPGTETRTLCGFDLTKHRMHTKVGPNPPTVGKVCTRCYEEPTSA